MTKIIALRKALLAVPLLACVACLANAQTFPSLQSIKSQEELENAVAALDTALFDSYNRCDLGKFAAFFADDVEFYHDQGGLTLGSKALTQSLEKNICGKVTRELVPGTLHVYPMKGYGALEVGVHRFHHPGQTTPNQSAKGGSFICGSTTAAPGKLRGLSATTTKRCRSRWSIFGEHPWVNSRER